MSCCGPFAMRVAALRALEQPAWSAGGRHPHAALPRGTGARPHPTERKATSATGRRPAVCSIFRRSGTSRPIPPGDAGRVVKSGAPPQRRSFPSPVSGTRQPIVVGPCAMCRRMTATRGFPADISGLTALRFFGSVRDARADDARPSDPSARQGDRISIRPTCSRRQSGVQALSCDRTSPNSCHVPFVKRARRIA